MDPIEWNDLADRVDAIDWGEVWKHRMAGWFSTVNDEGGDPFRHRRVNQGVSPVFIRRKMNERIRTRINGMDIRSGERVLVVGGTRVFGETLAKMGCSVTVVDSSPAAPDYPPPDKESPAIEVIDTRWERVSPEELPEKFDTLIALHALWTTDISSAIEKMNTAARSVYIFWYLTPPVWVQVMGEIWKKVHGREFHFAPTAECLYQVLLQKGIFANISIEEVGSNQFYANVGEALEAFRICTQFSEVCQDNVVRSYLRSRLTLADSGFTLRGSSRDAKIWWRSRDQG